VCYSLCGTEMGSFSAEHLRRNPVFCHIPCILHVVLSVLANRMFLSLWNYPLFPLLIYSNLTRVESVSARCTVCVSAPVIPILCLLRTILDTRLCALVRIGWFCSRNSWHGSLDGGVTYPARRARIPHYDVQIHRFFSLLLSNARHLSSRPNRLVR
jgi:hypothetical protein